MPISHSLDFFEQRDSLPVSGDPGISKVWRHTDGELSLTEPGSESNELPALSEVYCYRSDSGELLGLVVFFVDSPWKNNLTMMTHPEHRGQGICRSLLRVLIHDHWLEPDRQKYSAEGKAVMLKVLGTWLQDPELRESVPWASEYAKLWDRGQWPDSDSFT